MLFELFGDRCGVVCPQGNEVLGDDSAVPVVLLHVSAGCSGDVGRDLNAELGLSVKLGNTGSGFVWRGYIPWRRSCLSIRSASLVTRSFIAIVSYSSGNV